MLVTIYRPALTEVKPKPSQKRAAAEYYFPGQRYHDIRPSEAMRAKRQRRARKSMLFACRIIPYSLSRTDKGSGDGDTILLE